MLLKLTVNFTERAGKGCSSEIILLRKPTGFKFVVSCKMGQIIT